MYPDFISVIKKLMDGLITDKGYWWWTDVDGCPVEKGVAISDTERVALDMTYPNPDDRPY